MILIMILIKILKKIFLKFIHFINLLLNESKNYQKYKLKSLNFNCITSLK